MRRARVAAVIALIAGALVTTIIVIGAAGSAPYQLRLRVPDASGLTPNQDVKIDGVRAGQVESVQLGSDDQAEIEMVLDPNAGTVSSDATARIRSVSVLGEKYIEVERGSGDRQMPSGALIRPGKPALVELDDVLNTLDAGTAARLRVILAEGGLALTGRAKSVRELLGNLPDGMEQVSALLDEATADNHSLARAVEAGDRVLAAASARRDDLGRLVDEASGALQATADRRLALGEAVSEAPATLVHLRGSLGLLERASKSLEPTSDRLRAAARPVDRTLRVLPAFAGAAVPTLRSARATAPALTRIATAARPTVRHLRPVARRLAEVLRAADPLVQGLNKGLTDDLLYFAQTWARVTQRSDGLGHLFGVEVTVNEDTVKVIVDRVLSADAKERHRSPAKPSRPAQVAPAPARRPAIPGIPNVEKLVCKTVDGVSKLVPGEVGRHTPAPVREAGRLVCPDGNGGPATPPNIGDILDNPLGSNGVPQVPKPPADGSSDAQALMDYIFGS